MKTIEGINVIENVDDFLHDDKLSERFYTWSGEKDSDFINEPKRAARCHDAADGADGALHCEHIDDFREFGLDCIENSERAILKLIDNVDDEAEYTAKADLAIASCEECRVSLNKACDDLEQWHIANGSYEQQMG